MRYEIDTKNKKIIIFEATVNELLEFIGSGDFNEYEIVSYRENNWIYTPTLPTIPNIIPPQKKPYNPWGTWTC